MWGRREGAHAHTYKQWLRSKGKRGDGTIEEGCDGNVLFVS